MTTTDSLVTKYFNSFDGKNGNTIKVLPKEEELKLFRRWKKKKDKVALNKIIVANLKFVVKCANKYKGHADGKAIDINDLIQAGNEGLMHAIAGFQPKRNLKFITYAVHWINAYIRNFIYFNCGTIRVSLNNCTKVLIDQKWANYSLLNSKDGDAIDAWREAFKKKYQLSAKTMQAEEEKIQTVGSIFSMDKQRSIGDGGTPTTLHNELQDNQFQYSIENKNEQKLISERVRATLETIPQRDRDILKQRFGIDNLKRDIDPMTMQACGNKHGISKERVRQLENRALEMMKQELKKDPVIQEIIGLVC